MVTMYDIPLNIALEVDICVLLTWDTDMTDIELHVEEPDGQKCYSFCNHTKNGVWSFVLTPPLVRFFLGFCLVDPSRSVLIEHRCSVFSDPRASSIVRPPNVFLGFDAGVNRHPPFHHMDDCY